MNTSCLVLLSSVLCSTLGAIPVFVPTDPSAPLGTREGVTIQVSNDKFFAFDCFRMSVANNPCIIDFAPYYYLSAAQWLNSDRSALLADSKPLTSQVYLAVVYDDVIASWRDISGIAITNGVREWVAGPAYFICPGTGNNRYLQAFRQGSTAASILYDQVPLGTTVFPTIRLATPLDIALISDPSIGAAWSKKTKLNQLFSVSAAENILNTATPFEVVQHPNPLNKTEAGVEVITVSFFVEGGVKGRQASQVNYVVPYSDVYEVVGTVIPEGKKPFDVKDRPLPAERRTQINQQFLVVPKPQASVAPTPPPLLLTPDKQFVSHQVFMVLAPYYVKIGSLFVAVVPVCDTAGEPITNQFLAWNGSINPTDPASFTGAGSENSYIKISNDKTKLIIQATPYFASQAASDAPLYLGNISPNKAYQNGFVVAADERFFKGQALFYGSSLRSLQVTTKEEITENPYCVYPIALNLAVQRQRAYLDGNNNVIPVDFVTDDGTSFHGMLGVKTDFFAKGADTSSFLAPQPYYASIPSEQKFQFWYNISGDTLVQLPNDFSGSLITQMRQVSKEAFKLWPANLADRLSEKVASFICSKKVGKKLGFFERIAAVFDPSSSDYRQEADLKAYDPAVKI